MWAALFRESAWLPPSPAGEPLLPGLPGWPRGSGGASGVRADLEA